MNSGNCPGFSTHLCSSQGNTMFIINEMPKHVNPELIKLLERVEVATVGHFLYKGFLDRDIKAVLPEKRVAGTAVTVSVPHADSTVMHYLTKLVRPGDFLVVERSGDTRHACFGGAVANAMKIRGIAGIAIDGPATDFSEIRRIEMPLWCRGPSPITTKLMASGGGVNVPVSVGGQVVRPGDVVLADESGVVILDPSEAEAMALKAIAAQEAELRHIESLRTGAFLADISGATAMVENALAKA